MEISGFHFIHFDLCRVFLFNANNIEEIFAEIQVFLFWRKFYVTARTKNYMKKYSQMKQHLYRFKAMNQIYIN
jgi:hypothetical protein